MIQRKLAQRLICCGTKKQDVHQHNSFSHRLSRVPPLETSGSCQALTLLGYPSPYYSILQHLSLCCPGEEHSETQASAGSLWLFVAGTVCGQAVDLCGGKCQLSKHHWLLCLHQADSCPALNAKSLLCCVLCCRGDIMKGRQEWQNSYKRIVSCLIVSAAVVTFWTVAFFVSSILSEFPHHCHSYCETTQSNHAFVSSMDTSQYIVVVFVVITLVPAFLVTMTSSIWAFLVFRKKFMAASKKDAAYSRHIFLLPVVMVLLLFCICLLSYLITIVTDEVLTGQAWGYFSVIGPTFCRLCSTSCWTFFILCRILLYCCFFTHT